MPARRLGVGVVGAGRWANLAHLPGWVRDRRCQLVQEVVNAVEISHHERRWVDLPLEDSR